MTIIKEAFTEGRTRIVTWGDSESLKKVKLLELQHHNIKIFNSEYEKYEKKKIQQIDPNTGEILITFDGITAAAKYMILQLNKNKNDKTIYQLQGNIRMCMMKGFKAYGYYWKVLSHKSQEASVGVPEYENIINRRRGSTGRIKLSNRSRGNPFVVITSDGDIKKYLSIGKLCSDLSLSETWVRKKLKSRGFGITIKGNTIESYNQYNKMIKIGVA